MQFGITFCSKQKEDPAHNGLAQHTRLHSVAELVVMFLSCVPAMSEDAKGLKEQARAEAESVAVDCTSRSQATEPAAARVPAGQAKQAERLNAPPTAL